MDITIILTILGLTGVNTGVLLAIKYELGGLAAIQKVHARRLARLENEATVVKLKHQEA